MNRAGLILALSVATARASAQGPDPEPPPKPQLFATNVAIGAASAGVWRLIKHRPLMPGIARGALSGAGVWAGKRIIGNGGSANWWVGRQLAAIASSEVVNAGADLPVLERIVIPVGPIRFHLDRHAKKKISPRLDLVSAITAVVIGQRPGHRFAMRESLATGTMVYLVPEVSDAIGGHTAGVLTVSELAPNGNFPPLQSKNRVITHEMVHAAQYDFVFTAWNDAAQKAVEARLPAVRPYTRFFDVNMVIPLQLLANNLIEYGDRPWEKEAIALANFTR